MIKKFLSYYRPHIKIFTLDMFAALLLSACDLVYPMVARRIINIYIPDGNMKMIAAFGAVLLGIYLAKMGFTFFVDYYGHLMGVDMQAEMRRDLFAHLERLPFSFFDNNKTGVLMSRMTNDLQDVCELAHHGPEDLFISSVLFVGAFIILSGIDIILALITFIALPFMVFFAAKKRKKMNVAFAESRVKIGEVNASLENSISGIRISKAYTSASVEEANFERSNKAFVGARRRAYRAMAEFFMGTGFITDFLYLVVLMAGGAFVVIGRIDYGDFAAFLLYIAVFLQPIRKLINFTEQYESGITGFARFNEIMESETEHDREGAKEAPDLRGDIEFDNVSFSYGDGAEVLSGISFKVSAGRTLALVGESGGGKTTICHLLPRFYEVTGGEIRIDGIDIRDFTLASLRRQIGIVAQDIFLFDATIAENIAYGAPDAGEEDIRRAAEYANIAEYIESLPDGYNTLVGERGVRLSGGQKQRISIARVFLKNPPILILDEATSALDNVTERMIQESLSKLCEGRTTIVVAHRLSTVRTADEILLIDKSGIRERGTHESLMAQGGEYCRLVGNDAQPVVSQP